MTTVQKIKVSISWPFLTPHYPNCTPKEIEDEMVCPKRTLIISPSQSSEGQKYVLAPKVISTYPHVRQLLKHKKIKLRAIIWGSSRRSSLNFDVNLSPPQVVAAVVAAALASTLLELGLPQSVSLGSRPSERYAVWIKTCLVQRAYYSL